MTFAKAFSKSFGSSEAPTSFAMATKRLWRSASVSLGSVLRGMTNLISAATPKIHDSSGDIQAPREVRPVAFHEANSLLELERRGILPTAEYPVTYSALGKNGFGLFLYLEGGLDLQTLNRLAKCRDNRVGLAKFLAVGEGP